MGLTKGHSETIDMLVDKSFNTPGGYGGLPDAMQRLRQGKTAWKVEQILIRNDKVAVHNQKHFIRLNSVVRLEYKQREDFVDMYGVASTHILQERFRQYPVAYGLQKDSLFAQKIGAIIR